MITQTMTRELIGRQAYDVQGQKVGKIGQIYLDERSGTPSWATVNTGLFGQKESFVPLDGAGHGRADDGSMTRHEERLHVGTESEETGRVRLRKYVVTEDEQVTVPVSHEEVRLEREPLTEGAPAGDAEIGEDSQEVTLHAERPVVDKSTEAVENVRLGTRTVTEDRTVSDRVRKEQVDVDDPDDHVSGRHER